MMDWAEQITSNCDKQFVLVTGCTADKYFETNSNCDKQLILVTGCTADEYFDSSLFTGQYLDN